MNIINNTLLIVNHVQDKYLNTSDPLDMALRQKIFNFVDKLRPHIDKVAWSYAMDTSHDNLPFNLVNERSKSYEYGDLTLTNNNGNGLDSNFLQDIYNENPDQIILVGVYFEACSASTALTIQENIGAHVSVPMDMTNPPDLKFKEYYNSKVELLDKAGIDITSTSSQLYLQAINNKTGITPPVNTTTSVIHNDAL